mmetsp:Transcript_32892/g.51011  ORF Transcript_32892/g.51011 Transcript_32892/m.51011 type:complete len:195 (+) Transcript_32892:12-596(+)
MDPPGYSDYAPPPFEDLPVYEGPNYGNSGINLNKPSEGIKLDKSEPEYRDTSAPPFESAPPNYSEPANQHDNNRSPSNAPSNVVVVGSQPGELAFLFHILSITCCLLSLIFSPLIEIVPMVLLCFMRADLKSTANNGALHALDYVITLVTFIIYLALIVVLAVFTFGIGLVLLVFLIPYVFVLIGLTEARPNSA